MSPYPNSPRRGRGRTRSVRLDPEAEAALDEICRETGSSISDALKRGLLVVREALRQETVSRPYALYESIDIGPGGYARTPASDAKAGVKAAIRQKHRR